MWIKNKQIERLNENWIQKTLLHSLDDNNSIMIPNIFLNLRYFQDFEMDLMKYRVYSRFIIEYEIKCSKADFKKDFDKGKRSYKKHELIRDKKLANRFFYVVPESIKDIEVPEYAGLIYVSHKTCKKNNYSSAGTYIHTNLVKDAPLIHKEKFDIKDILIMKLYNKYYNKLISEME